jgi:hypothetical protein
MPTNSTIRAELALIRTVLRFVNLREIASTGQVERLFRRLPAIHQPFQVVPADRKHVLIYKEGQADYRRWLTAIPDDRVSDEVVREVNGVLRRAVAIVFTVEKGRLEARYWLDGVEAAVSFAVALLLDEKRGYGKRLERCDAPGCGKFRLTFGGGRPMKYCSRAHRVAAEIARR